MQDIIGIYIKHGQAFGPTDAGLIREHKNVLKQLFDPQNKICGALQKNPSIIIGRRGSGKTAFLYSVLSDQQYTIIQEIKTSKTFSKIVEIIEKNSRRHLFVEDIADLWEELFYFALMTKMAENYKWKYDELRLISDYLAKEGLSSASSFDTFLWKLIEVIRKRAGNNLVGAIADIIKEITGITFENAKLLINKILQDDKQRAILLLDSLEQYPTSIPSVAHALSGLLKCVGQFNTRNENFNLRLCLPAELYHVFLDVTSNPLKDLAPANTITLHWSAGELLSVAAHRLSLYLTLYFPELNNQLPQINLINRENIQALFKQFFPDQITNNKLKINEDPLAYILRHTQLQPRHLLIYLNAIFEMQRELNPSLYPRISEEAIKSAIKKTEHLLCEEVFSGFKTLYPTARAVCETCIPELPLRFSNSELQKVFTRKGKKSSTFTDFWDFHRLLIETGIIGRVIRDRETERYIIGRFEYTEPHKLVVSTEDELCLHPVFAEVYNYKESKDVKTIYPYGSDPEEDYRVW